jgi:hypothetical protein
VEFKLSAIGSTPKLAIVDDASTVTFERLLLNRADNKRITLASRSALPLAWKVRPDDLAAVEGEGGADGKPDCSIAPTSGVIAPGDVVDVRITFHARAADVLQRSFHIDVSDYHKGMTLEPPQEPVLGVVETLPVELNAEAYNIDVDVLWPNPESEAEDGTKSGVNGIDFGAFKVVDAQESALTLVNRGKYDVGFKFVMRGKLMREILSFEPSEGTLEPGGTELKVEVKLKTEGELDLVANTDVRIQFTEILTGEMMNDLTMPLKLWAHAVYSKYAVVPRGINFGPMIYSSQRERSFELQNTGEFAFKYGLRDFDAEPTDESKGSELKLSNFTMSPPAGEVEAGGAVTITIKFDAGADAQAFRSMVAIDVADCEPSHDPLGLQYELLGEACISGIDTFDWQSMFEE